MHELEIQGKRLEVGLSENIHKLLLYFSRLSNSSHSPNNISAYSHPCLCAVFRSHFTYRHQALPEGSIKIQVLAYLYYPYVCKPNQPANSWGLNHAYCLVGISFNPHAFSVLYRRQGLLFLIQEEVH
jgi:hypothetical protein